MSVRSLGVRSLGVPSGARTAGVVPGGGVAIRTVETPIGPLMLVAGSNGLRAVLWPGEDGSRVPGSAAWLARPETSAALGHAPVDARGSDAAGPDAATAHLDSAQAQLEEYFAGTRREFDLVLDPGGTAFQRSAWEVLRTIPFGSTMSYRDQAAALGDAAKARAVGAANGRNPISVVVACHRVVAASGALTGFAGGLDTKAWLLAHERRCLELS